MASSRPSLDVMVKSIRSKRLNLYNEDGEAKGWREKSCSRLRGLMGVKGTTDLL
jgi:hypothetical protein